MVVVVARRAEARPAGLLVLRPMSGDPFAEMLEHDEVYGEPAHLAAERHEAHRFVTASNGSKGTADAGPEIHPVGQDAAPVTDVTGDEPDRSRFADGARFLLDHDDSTDEILWGQRSEALWVAGESALVCGPQGVGKSVLLQQLALRRAGVLTGPLLGWPVAPGEGRVLYLAMDRPRQVRRSMRRMVSDEHRGTLEDRLVVWQGPPPADMAQRPEVLVQLAQRADAATVVVDSVKDAAVGVAEDAVGAGLNRAVQLALVNGIEVLAAHHQRKRQQGAGRPGSLDDVYGSVWVTAGAGSVLLLWGEAGDLIVELSHLKQPEDAVGPMRVLLDLDAGTVERHEDVDLLKLAAAKPDGLTAREAAMVLHDTDDPDRNQVERARRRLDKHAGLRRDPGQTPAGGGKSATHYRPATDPIEGAT